MLQPKLYINDIFNQPTPSPSLELQASSLLPNQHLLVIYLGWPVETDHVTFINNLQ